MVDFAKINQHNRLNVLLRTDNSFKTIKYVKEDSIDALITDPPYEIGMSSWDWKSIAFNPRFWKRAKRALKPGSFCLVFGGTRTYHRMASAVEEAGFEVLDMISWWYATGYPKGNRLKPAQEPILVARKPLSEKTLKANMRRWGVGAYNIEASRVPFVGKAPTGSGRGNPNSIFSQVATSKGNGGNVTPKEGRWPANVIVDPTIKGALGVPFFYCPKPTGREKRAEENSHPTVKPLNLMRYLVRLVTFDPQQTVLDPFMGSGTTPVACVKENRKYYCMEREVDYFNIASRRINLAVVRT